MKRLLTILTAFLLMVSCETTTEIIYPSTDLELTVLDEDGNTVTGAQVKMYDQKELYEQAKLEGTPGLEISIDLTDIEGRVYYTDLNHEIDYYFFINYRSLRGRGRGVSQRDCTRDSCAPGSNRRSRRIAAV